MCGAGRRAPHDRGGVRARRTGTGLRARDGRRRGRRGEVPDAPRGVIAAGRPGAPPGGSLPAVRRGHHVLAGGRDREAGGRDRRGGSRRRCRRRRSRSSSPATEDAALDPEPGGGRDRTGRAPAGHPGDVLGVPPLLETLAAERPLVAVFDDIHWAEPTLLDLLEYVAGFSQATRSCCCAWHGPSSGGRPGVGTGRDGRHALSRSRSTQSERPHPAPHRRRRALPAGVRDRIVEAAEGNPLFVEEMLRMLIDDGLAPP